jgi:2-keto-4-pentenoate hydratase/2-oxohepta-3-ene-1,7-dioic acid hydratase in catechol pathway
LEKKQLITSSGSDEVFPVRRIYCIGRNYRAHSIEMGSNPDREPPFFFQKPTDAIQYVARHGGGPPLSLADEELPLRSELVAVLGKGGRNIPVDKALDLVWGYTLGLDMTRRDLQRAMGDEKKPWEIGKSFDRSAPIGPVHRVAQTGHFTQGRDLAQGQRPDQAERQPQPDDLVGGRADQQAVRGQRAVPRRHHLFRHAGERRPGGARAT